MSTLLLATKTDVLSSVVQQHPSTVQCDVWIDGWRGGCKMGPFMDGQIYGWIEESFIKGGMDDLDDNLALMVCLIIYIICLLYQCIKDLFDG